MKSSLYLLQLEKVGTQYWRPRAGKYLKKKNNTLNDSPGPSPLS